MNLSIKSYKTKELVEELMKREGVQSQSILPYEPYKIVTGTNGIVRYDKGAAIILIIED